jgi:predicted AAA+ superfamily ATPase
VMTRAPVNAAYVVEAPYRTVPCQFGCDITRDIGTDLFMYNRSIKMDITPILRDQNPWWKDPKYQGILAFHRRHHPFDRIQEYLGDKHDGRAIALLGPRQVGKTTLLLQLVDELISRGWPPGNLTFFDFSDERLVDSVSPREIVAIEPMGLSPDHPRVFLFDEIQNADAWQKWLKIAVDQSRRSRDRPPHRFIVTGSAATSLREGSIESGQGRWDELPIEGLTFTEFLRLGSPVEEDSRRTASREPQAFERYLAFGGFPEHVRAEFPRTVRRRIRDDIADRAILRDLRQTGVDLDRVRRLFVHLVAGSGNTWSQGKRADDLDANRKSVGEWLSLLEATRLVVRLDRDRTTGLRARTELRSQPKIFASDHGLITAFSTQPEPLDVADVRGRVFEAVVFRHLRELSRMGNGELTFIRLDDDLELDFVVRYPSVTVGVGVTSSTEATPRKLGRSVDIMRKAGIDRKVLIHGGLLATRLSDVDIVPLHEFLSTPEKYAGGDR